MLKITIICCALFFIEQINKLKRDLNYKFAQSKSSTTISINEKNSRTNYTQVTNHYFN